VDASGAEQANWYLGSHASYGLYSNTGLKLEGSLYAANVYAANIPAYSEGTWTPYLSADGGASGQAYSSQQGYYIKIGKLVFVQGYVALSAMGTLTGAILLCGLPFIQSNIVSAFGGFVVPYWANCNMNVVGITIQGLYNNTSMYLRHMQAGGATSIIVLTQGAITNSFTFAFSGTYSTGF